jgi:hypothetical protein
MHIFSFQRDYDETGNLIDSIPYYYMLALEKIGDFIFFWIVYYIGSIIPLLITISIICGILLYLFFERKREK